MGGNTAVLVDNVTREDMILEMVEVTGLEHEKIDSLDDSILTDGYRILVLEPRQEHERREQARKRHEAELARRYTKAPVGFKWVNVYEITRCYGGPEEGGWWYNNWECIKARLVPNRKIGHVLATFEARFQDYGNIYSVRGGAQYVVDVELIRANQETSKKPYYE